MSYEKLVAQEKIAALLLRNASFAARERMKQDAREQKQSLYEIAMRRAGNLLDSYVTHKPGGFVEF